MGLVTDIIKGLPISAVLQDKLQELEKRFEQLEAENRELRAENGALRAQLRAATVTSDFEDINGLLWKKKAFGGFENKPRCPVCSNHPVLFDFPPDEKMFWNCSVCKGTFDYAEAPSH
jgi:hypothetical protein